MKIDVLTDFKFSKIQYKDMDELEYWLNNQFKVILNESIELSLRNRALKSELLKSEKLIYKLKKLLEGN